MVTARRSARARGRRGFMRRPATWRVHGADARVAVELPDHDRPRGLRAARRLAPASGQRARIKASCKWSHGRARSDPAAAAALQRRDRRLQQVLG